MRKKKSIYNLITKLFASIVPSLLAIILTNLIILNYGSEINGLVATIAQFMNFISLVEGGFALSSNFALYKPFVNSQHEQVSDILSATKITYRKIALITFGVSFVISIMSPLYIKSNVDAIILISLFLIASLKITFNFYFIYKYNVMFSAAQKEYLTTFVNMIFLIVSQVMAMIAINLGFNIVVVQACLVIIPLFRLKVIRNYFLEVFPTLSFKSSKPDFRAIESTKDVLMQKIAGLVFNSTDMILISIIIGLAYSSVYAVYNMIFQFVKVIIFAAILAPFNAFGQLYAEGQLDKLKYYFGIYQFSIMTLVNIFITTTLVLIEPFLTLYTKNFYDVNYLSSGIAVMFSIFVSLDLISNITGSIVNSTGHFKEMKMISLYSALINISLSSILGYVFGINGILLGTVFALMIINFQLARLAHTKILKDGCFSFYRYLITNVMISVIVLFCFSKFYFEYNNYFDFIKHGIISIVIVTILTIIGNSIFNKNIFKLAYNEFKKIIGRKEY